MRLSKNLLLAVMIAAPSVASADDLSTQFTGTMLDAGNFFNITASTDIVVTGLSGHYPLGAVTADIYTFPGGYSGNEFTPGLWTLQGTASFSSLGPGNATEIPALLDIAIAAGATMGFYVTTTCSSGVQQYSSFFNGGVSNGDITISDGIANACNFGFIAFNSRSWDGIVTYQRGTVDLYGAGCPGSGGFVPDLFLDGNIGQGGTLDLVISSGLGGANGILFLGATQASAPLGCGCNFLVAPVLPAFLPLTLSGAGPGGGSLILQNVNLPVFAGGYSVTMQALFQDFGAQCQVSSTQGGSLDVF